MGETTPTRGARRLTDRAASTDVQRSRWQRRAACRKVPTTLFFPAGNYTRVAEEQAKTVCSSCPVRIPCLTFAIEHGEPFGVWGGLTAEERRVLAAPLPEEGEGSC